MLRSPRGCCDARRAVRRPCRRFSAPGRANRSAAPCPERTRPLRVCAPRRAARARRGARLWRSSATSVGARVVFFQRMRKRSRFGASRKRLTRSQCWARCVPSLQSTFQYDHFADGDRHWTAKQLCKARGALRSVSARRTLPDCIGSKSRGRPRAAAPLRSAAGITPTIDP